MAYRRHGGDGGSQHVGLKTPKKGQGHRYQDHAAKDTMELDDGNVNGSWI
jgi:hypothetical protein